MEETRAASFSKKHLLWQGSWSCRKISRHPRPRGAGTDEPHHHWHERGGAAETRIRSDREGDPSSSMSQQLWKHSRRTDDAARQTGSTSPGRRRRSPDLGKEFGGGGACRPSRRASRFEEERRRAEEESSRSRGSREGQEEEKEKGEAKGQEGIEEGNQRGGRARGDGEQHRRQERQRKECGWKAECEEGARGHLWTDRIRPSQEHPAQGHEARPEKDQEESQEQFLIFDLGECELGRFSEGNRPARRPISLTSDSEARPRDPFSSRPEEYEGIVSGLGRNVDGGGQFPLTGDSSLCPQRNGAQDVWRGPTGGHDTGYNGGPGNPRPGDGGSGYCHPKTQILGGSGGRLLVDSWRKVGTAAKSHSTDSITWRDAIRREGDEARCPSEKRGPREFQQRRSPTHFQRKIEREGHGEGKWQRQEERQRVREEEGRVTKAAKKAEEALGEVSPVRCSEDVIAMPLSLRRKEIQGEDGDQNQGEVSPVEATRREEKKVPGVDPLQNKRRDDAEFRRFDDLAEDNTGRVPIFVTEEPKYTMDDEPVRHGRLDKYELPSCFTLGTFGVPAEAATSCKIVQKPEAEPGKKNECGFTWDGGFVEVAEWLGGRIDALFDKRCKAKPTGRIFPLPTSIQILQTALEGVFEGCWVSLRLLVSLNSLNGEGCFFEGKASAFQQEVLRYLAEQVTRVQQWKDPQEPASWGSFFKVRTVDYLGEEVKTAQAIEWRNISPALPEEVGGVDLREVVDLGCRHYVSHFEEYLVPEEDQIYTKPPKVMVPQESWAEVCEGLISKGVCGLIGEDQVHRVQGKLLLNGLFGVSKGEFHGGAEVMRLIMNLIPLNGICKGIDGDVSTLPSWAGMSAFQLHPHEDLVISSEDVRCFFYIFRVPESWYPYLAFNRPVPDHLNNEPGKKSYLCSRVLPMGFKNSVSLAQHVHRFVLRQAVRLSGAPVGFEGEIRKDKPFTTQEWLFRVYLDNFDELRKVNRSMAEAIEGKISPLVSGLRDEYLRWGIPRHPKKSVQQQRVAEVQGALVDGTLGQAYPKPEKVLKYAQLACHLLASGASTVKQAQVIGRGFVYLAMFRRPLLGSLNSLWRFILGFDGSPPFIKHALPTEVQVEISRFVGMVPLAYMDFRCGVSARVTASDASEYGGGVCVSTKLTPVGCVAAQSKVRGDILEPEEATPVLTIGLFDGIGALRVAADALGWTVLGHVSVECDPQARRVLECQFPNCIEVSDVCQVDYSMVKDWAAKYGQVAVVIIGAGPPCQGVSGLNSDRRGALKDHRSSLFQHVPRIKELVKRCFPWAQVRSLMESVSSMDECDRVVMSREIGCTPWEVDAASFSIARRPRLYWLDWELFDDRWISCDPGLDQGWSTVHKVEGEVPVQEDQYLKPGWKTTRKLPTFTTSRPREHPGRKPAGLGQCQSHERERWTQDKHRFPPYQYVDGNCLHNRQGQVRLPNPEEREVIMGFPRDYTVQCCKKSEQGGEAHRDKRLSLIGNSWNVTVVTWLLGCLGYVLGLNPKVTSKEAVSRTAPGCRMSLQTFLRRPLMKAPPLTKTPPGLEGRLVHKLMTLVSMKGEDLMLQASSEDLVHYHRLRASIPANLWKWSTAASWKWTGSKEHINVLEMRAVLCALKWRIERQHKTRIKFVHLVDSQVCLHALSRGRSSSRKLRRTLLRINSLLLATGSHVLWTYVHTKQNPADAPSRRAGKRKWRNA